MVSAFSELMLLKVHCVLATHFSSSSFSIHYLSDFFSKFDQVNHVHVLWDKYDKVLVACKSFQMGAIEKLKQVLRKYRNRAEQYMTLQYFKNKVGANSEQYDLFGHCYTKCN